MPAVIKKAQVHYKDASGQYVSTDVVAEQTTAQKVAQLQAEGAAQMQAIQTKGEQTRASIPADYTALSDQVGNLKSAVNDCEAAIGRTDVSVGHWVIGTVTSSGVDPTNKTRMHYDGMLSFAEGKKFILKADEGFQLSMLIYTTLDDYSSLVSSTTWTSEREFTGDNRYYVVVARRTNNTNMDVNTDAPNVHIYYGLNSLDDDISRLETDIEAIEGDVINVQSGIADCKNAIGENDVTEGQWVLGSVNSSGPQPETKTRMHYNGMLYFDIGKTAVASADTGYEVSWLIFTTLNDYSSLVSSTGWGSEKPVTGDGRYYVPIARRANNTNMDVETDSPHLHVYYGLNSVVELHERVNSLENGVDEISEEIENIKNVTPKDKLYYNDEFSANGLIHRVYNPYKNGGLLVLNGQMHCHSRSESTGKYYDGTDSAAATLQAFLSAGYDFMTITDYGNTYGGVTKPDANDIPSGLVWMFDSQEVRALGGANYGSKHIPLYNFNTAIPSVSNVSIDAFANQYLDKFTFVSLAHPFYIDTPVSIEELNKINSHVRFVELYNGLSAYLNDNDPSKPYVLPSGKDIDYAFETMLDNGLVTWGLAVSDSHSLSDSFLKKGCIKLFSNSKDKYTILENLWAGNFYCTEWLDTGIESISFADGVFSIDTGDSEATTVFKKEGGAIVKTQTGANVSYQMTGEEKYVRAIVTKGNGNRIWTQPIIIIKEFDFSVFN